MPDANSSMAVVPVDEIRPLLIKRRSCELVKTPAPCVNKALFHLGRLKELLRVALENPTQIEHGRLTELEAQKLFDNHPKGWKHLRFDVPRRKESNTSSSYSFESSEDFVKDEPLLTITGIGGQIKDDERGDADRIVHVSQLEEKNQLPPQEVFSQVRQLIVRLEEDRRLTELALGVEDGKVNSLSEKIDRMCQKRLLQLPLAVQKEHDACAADISELQWHVGYMERQLERCRQRVQVAEVLNNRLKDDIAFVKKHCPLVEEKLILEKDAMQKIKTMQKQTDNELSDARIELDKAEAKYQEASEKAENERLTTQKKLEGIRGQLRLLKKDLQHSEALHAAYLKKAEQSRQKLADQEEELINLQKRAEEAKDEEQAEIYKIEDLRQQIKEVEFETGEVNKQKAGVENEIENLNDTMKEKIGALETKYHNSLRTLRKLQEDNRDMKLDIEDMNEEIKTCDKSISKCEREVERYKKERERCDSQLKEASTEVSRVTVINNELKIQLQKEETKSQAMEDALKTQAESLRKRVIEEMRQRTVLETKKQNNSQALLKGKAENKKKRAKVAKTLQDTESSVAKIQEDVDKLKKQHDSTTQEVNELEAKLAQVRSEHEKEENILTKERDVLAPQEKDLLATQLSLQSKIKEMEFEEEQMRQKLKDMKVSKNAMKKRIATTEENIANITDDLEEVSLRLESSKKKNSELQKQLDEASGRLAERKKDHHEMMDSRLQIKVKLETNIHDELDRNKELAQDYRDLQSEYIDLKNRLMSLYDNKVKLEASIKDHKQLLALQEKFNVALKQYYHDRGEFNKAGLHKFHSEAEDNSNAMVKIQTGLQKTITNISKFLKSQIDGGAANEVQEAAMKHLLTDDSLITA
ncbi:coiled-coil domain-containing protein 178-like [Styela clava]